MKAVKHVDYETVEAFVTNHLLAGQNVRTDAFRWLNMFNTTQQYDSRRTPSDKVNEWLPWFHIVIDALKAFLLGTFDEVTNKCVQEYLDDFCYRFNRRFIEKKDP